MPDSDPLYLRVAYAEPEAATKALQDLAVAAEDAEDGSKGLEREFKRVVRPIRDVGKVGTDASKKVASLSTEFRRMARSAANSGQPLNVVAQRIGAISQILGGVAGALAGGVITVGLVALVQNLRGIADEGERAEKALSEFNEAINAFHSSARQAISTTQELVNQFGELAGQVREFSRLQAELRLAETFSALGKALDTNLSAMDKFARQWERVNQSALEYGRKAADLDAMTDKSSEAALALSSELSDHARSLDEMHQILTVMADEMGLTVEQARKLSTAINDVKMAQLSGDTRQVADALDRMRQMALSLYGDVRRMPEPLREMLSIAGDIHEQIARADVESKELHSTWQSIVRAIRDAVAGAPGDGWLAGAISDASTLAGAMWDVVAAKVAAAGDLDAAGNPVPSGMPAAGRRPPRRPGVNSYGDFLAAGRGAGGGGADRSFVDTLLDDLRTEQEALAAWQAERLDMLARATDAELEAIGGRNEAKLRLEQEYQDRLREIIAGETDYRLTETADMFSALADVAEAGGKGMLKVQAALSAASAIISGYEAAMKAAAEAKTIPGRIAAYAKFVALGLSAAASIRSAGNSGSGHSRGAGGASATAPVEPPQPVQVSIQGVDPDSWYQGRQIQELTTAVQKDLQKRGVIITYVGA